MTGTFLIALAVTAASAGVGQQDAVARGLTQLMHGEYREAIANLERDPAASPAVSRGYLEALMAIGRYDQAESEAVRLAAAAPAAQVFTSYGRILRRLGKLEEADHAFAKAVRDGASDALVAEFERAELLVARGQLDSALTRFSAFVDVYNQRRDFNSRELMVIASAARYLGIENNQLFRDAVRVYDEAVARDSSNLEAWVLLGELFLDKYNSADASAVFSDVLRINPRHPDALLGLARAMHFDGQREAMQTVEAALAVNPKSVPALVFRAELMLELEKYGEADELIGEALDVNPRSLEALSVRAAIRYLRGDRVGFGRIERTILAANPRYAELYNKLAELAARNRQYADAVALGRKALEVDPRSWRAYGLVGLNELRTGAMEEGRRHLEVSFEGDPYNVWIKNTLDLIDTFGDYTTVTSRRFEIVLHESEADLLAPYMIDVAEEAFERLSARYGAEPPTPIRLEVYPRHADFSVRTVGLAGMGALGVSFGSVLAMDSPSARDAGDFNWASTLWHEIAHAFHLAMTEHRVPRWFTEGLAVHEERNARPGWGWGDDIDIGFLVAYRDGRLHPVSRLNEGFVRPSYPGHVGHSYLQASLVCEFIESEWGTDALLRLMGAYRRGLTGTDVIREVLDLGPEGFDEAFDDYFRSRFSHALVALGDLKPEEPRPKLSEREVGVWAERRPGSFPAQMTAGQVLFGAERLSEARVYFEKARNLFPEYAGADSPAWFLAQIDRLQGRLEDAERWLVQLTAANGRHYDALGALADVREDLGRTAAAADALHRRMFIYPYGMESHDRLATLYAEVGNVDGAVRERRAVVAMDPVDIAAARFQLARAYLDAGNLRMARREVLRTLEKAPNYVEAQDLLLEIRNRGRLR